MGASAGKERNIGTGGVVPRRGHSQADVSPPVPGRTAPRRPSSPSRYAPDASRPVTSALSRTTELGQHNPDAPSSPGPASPMPVADLKVAKAPPLNSTALVEPSRQPQPSRPNDKFAFIAGLELLDSCDATPTSDTYHIRNQQRRMSTTSSGPDPTAQYFVHNASAPSSAPASQTLRRKPSQNKKVENQIPPRESPVVDELIDIFWSCTAKQRQTQPIPPKSPCAALPETESTRTVLDRRRRERQLLDESLVSSTNQRYSLETDQISPVRELRRVFSHGGQLRKAKNQDSFYFMPAVAVQPSGLPTSRAGRATSKSSVKDESVAPSHVGTQPFNTVRPQHSDGANSTQSVSPGNGRKHPRSEVGGTSHFALSLVPAQGQEDVFYYDIVPAERAFCDVAATSDDEESDSDHDDEGSDDMDDAKSAPLPTGEDGSEMSDEDLQQRRGSLMATWTRTYDVASGMLCRHSTAAMADGTEKTRPSTLPDHSAPLFTTSPAFVDDDSSDDDLQNTSSASSSRGSSDGSGKSSRMPRGASKPKPRAKVPQSQRTSLYRMGPMRASVRLSDGQLHKIVLLPKSSMKRAAGPGPHHTHENDQGDAVFGSEKSLGPSLSGPLGFAAASRVLGNSFFAPSEGYLTTAVSYGECDPMMGVTSEQLSVHTSDDDDDTDDATGGSPDDDISTFCTREAAEVETFNGGFTDETEGLATGGRMRHTPSGRSRRHSAESHRHAADARIGACGAVLTGLRRTRVRPVKQTKMANPMAYTSVPGDFPSFPPPARGQPMLWSAASPNRFSPSDMQNVAASPHGTSAHGKQQQRRLSQTAPLYEPASECVSRELTHARPRTSPASIMLDKATIARLRAAAAEEVSRFSLNTVRYVASPNWDALEAGDEDKDEDGEDPISITARVNRNVRYDDGTSTAARDVLETMHDQTTHSAVVSPVVCQQWNRPPPTKSSAPFRTAQKGFAADDIFMPLPRVRH